MKKNRASQPNSVLRESSYVAPAAVEKDTGVSLDYVVTAPVSPDTVFPSTTSKTLPASSEETKTYWNDDAIPSTYFSDDLGKGNGRDMHERLTPNSGETRVSGEAPLVKNYPGESRSYENNPLLSVDKENAVST